MSVEFDVKLTPQDMFRFNMYHTYTGFQGIFSLVIGVVVMIMAAATIGTVDALYTGVYFLLGILFIVYNPISLYRSARKKMGKSEILKETLHYKMDDGGITVNVGEAKAELPWAQIYKIVTTKSNLLVYSTRRNAYVIPLESLGTGYQQVRDIMEKQVEDYRLKLRKKR